MISSMENTLCNFFFFILHFVLFLVSLCCLRGCAPMVRTQCSARNGPREPRETCTFKNKSLAMPKESSGFQKT